MILSVTLCLNSVSTYWDIKRLLVGWYLRLTLCEVSNPDYYDIENILYLGLSPLLYRRKGINRCLVPIFFSDAMEYEKCVSGLDKSQPYRTEFLLLLLSVTFFTHPNSEHFMCIFNR